METLRHPLLPRRITQLYADTKRSYEHMVQHSDRVAQPSGTHIKLRIQKDRLIAWGLEWADSNTAQNGDIDGSLDRAGISDLVGSIMSSIRDLLDRADRIQPQRSISFPGVFPDDKRGFNVGKEPQWSAQDLLRLDDILKDLTTSIDTLCDLSRSRQVISQRWKAQNPMSPPAISAEASSFSKGALLQEKDSLIYATRIDMRRLLIPEKKNLLDQISSPPSYESVAANSEDRILAYMKTQDEHTERSTSSVSDVPVLLEYIPKIDVAWTGTQKPPSERYGKLMELQPSATGTHQSTYLGSLKLLGWMDDTDRSRNALVYEIPQFSLHTPFRSNRTLQSHTLLSFLQHGADTDRTNMPCLEDRFRLAFNVSSSLLHLHAKGVFHRNINSKNVIFFSDEGLAFQDDVKPWKNGIIRRPFLTSFDQCAEDVYGEVEEPFISNIYRHPQVERGRRSSFKAVFDVYSLGLILLEIGLWMPISKLWKTRYTRGNFKNRLQTIYTRKLAGKCGSNYMRVVEYCLKAGDQQSPSSAVETWQPGKDARPSSSQTDFYWRAFKVLERCCMIDDTEDPTSQIDQLNDSRDDQSQEATLPGLTSPAGPEVSSTRVTEARPEKLNSSLYRSEKVEETPQPEVKRKCKCKVWSHEIPTVFKTHWQQALEPRLNRMFSKIIDRWESYSIELLMAGETAEVARPTIYMVCSSVEKARKVLQYVNRDQGLFDIKVSRGQIIRSKAGKKKRQKKRSTCRVAKLPMSGPIDSQLRFQHYQEQPTCGASIGAYLNDQHLPPVSFGGTIMVGGEAYGMSVHHMLENDDIDLGLEDMVDLRRSMAPRKASNESTEGSTDFLWTTAAPPEALYPFEISEDEDEGYRSSAEAEEEWDFDPAQWDKPEILDTSDVDMGDTLGVAPGEGTDLMVTQPAIDDVDEGFFPNEEDMDEDHLSSHTLGHVHASSGLRRTSRGTISHEVDWALIKIRGNRRREVNFVKDGTRHCRTSYPHGVVKTEELGGLKVHALGRTSGLQTGTILPSMVIVKMPGRISHSHSWQVAGNFGTGGDSGAWVIDNTTGAVCAHVLAWSERSKTAYVAPMEVLLDDIAETLGAEVTLPGQEQVNIETRAEGLNSEDSSESKAQVGSLRGGQTSPRVRSQDGKETDEDEESEKSNATRTRYSSPPIATSPPQQRALQGVVDSGAPPKLQDSEVLRQVNTACSPASKRAILDSKRRSGSEMLMEKGEESFKANCRISMG